MRPHTQWLTRLAVIGLRASASQAFFQQPLIRQPYGWLQSRAFGRSTIFGTCISSTRVQLQSHWRHNPVQGVLGIRAETGVTPPKDASGDSIFCKIIRKEIPANVVHEDDLCLAFKDVAPTAPVHILVIPKPKITQLSKASAELGNADDVKLLLGHMLLVAADIGKKHSPGGFRCVINDGKEGCQSVYRLHIHVIGGKQLGWPPTGN